ncbi:ATP-dependent RNA helicase DBP4, partial [Bienertia sinuspersici]
MERKALGSEESTERISKEEIARKTWRNIRLQGHTYVDLRKDGKRSVYFCILCLASCYSEPILRGHLGGKLHRRMYTAAKATLIGQNPWPFDDGFVFFNSNVDVKEKDIASGNRTNLLDDHEHVDNLAVVVHNDVPNSGGDQSHFNEEVAVDELIIPNVIGPVEVSDLRVKLMGYGKISANLLEKDGANTDMQSIWCEWLGKMGGEIDDIDSDLPTHEFAIITFEYFYDLGKRGLFKDILPLIDSNISVKRRKISCSDSEDASRALSHVSYSSGEDPQCSRTNTTLALLVRDYTDELLHSKKFIPNNKLRKRLRKEQHIASKKTCFICKRTIISGKDVATLLNLKTGRLVCSSRNLKGAFHVFHTSCLIHWILLCESEMFLKPPVHPKVIGKSKKAKSKVNQPRRKSEEGHISSVFCPDCRGT